MPHSYLRQEDFCHLAGEKHPSDRVLPQVLALFLSVHLVSSCHSLSTAQITLLLKSPIGVTGSCMMSGVMID